MLEGVNKLKGRSLAELRVRGAQAIAGYAERHGLGSQSRGLSDVVFYRLLDTSRFSNPPETDESLLTHFQTRSSPKCFAAFDDPTDTKELLSQIFGDQHERLIEQANQINKGRFKLLGYDNLNFGEPINWHREPFSGQESPLIHWSRIDELDPNYVGDQKIVWELNRHTYFSTLGRAYWATGNERYAVTWANHLSHWMDQNPPKLGFNWVSSLEVALRSISWLWALEFFKHSVNLTPALYKRALKYLYQHARHVETYLSTYSSPNTHLTGEALGLFYLGTLLPEFRESSRWRHTGRRILLEELARHVLPDGVYFEQTSYYHRYTTDFYLHFLILSERNDDAVGDEVKTKLQSLLDHLMYITRPDGTTPLIGDDDGGQLVRLDDLDCNDFRNTLSTGAALFHREDHKYVADQAAESTLWLLGSEGMRVFEQLASHPPAAMSRAFPDGGYYVMRDGWTDEDNYLLIDCGPHGVFNCGHAHADALSFDLAAKGRTMLVDSGTFTYTGSQEFRDYFRSSEAHNTLTVDGKSSSVPDGPFSWKQIAHSSNLAWKNTARFDFFSGTHDGYQRLHPDPVKHTRSVLFLKNDYWVMRDSVETNGAHSYELNFHFAPDTHPCLGVDANAIESTRDPAVETAGLEVFSFALDGRWWRNDMQGVSTCYGALTRMPFYKFIDNGNGGKEFFTFLIPRRVTDERVQINELEAKGGQAFEILGWRFRDLFIGGNGTKIDAARISSDFKWAWARFAANDETLEELVLIDGRSFYLDGQKILSSGTHVDYVVAHRFGDKLRLKIDSNVLEVELPDADFAPSEAFSNSTSDV